MRMWQRRTDQSCFSLQLGVDWPPKSERNIELDDALAKRKYGGSLRTEV